MSTTGSGSTGRVNTLETFTCILPAPANLGICFSPGVPPLQPTRSTLTLTSTGILLLPSVDPVAASCCLWGWNLGQNLPSDPRQVR